MASLRYPAEIINDTTDWFRIGIAKYNPTQATVVEGRTINNLLGSGNYPEDQVITLPIPSNVQDGNSVSYGDDKLNTLTAAGVEAVSKTMSADVGDNLAQAVTTIGTNISTEARNFFANYGEDVRKLILKGLSAEAVSIFGGNVSIDSLLARESGQILNPNMELLFNGVTLRNFRFTFKMTPRDQDESDNVKLILRTLKKRMAAKGGTTFLGTPDVFLLSYMKGKGSHPFLHKFKPCFLKDMTVNYTGENVYAVYSDGTPVSMTMDLNFQEMFPIYESDYTNIDLDKEGVGF